LVTLNRNIFAINLNVKKRSECEKQKTKKQAKNKYVSK